MTALPINPYPPGNWYDAYEECLRFEVGSQSRKTQYGASSLVCARVLGYLMIEAPTDEGRNKISIEISSCTDQSSMITLGNHYIDHLLRCFKTQNSRTPTPARHASRTPLDDAQQTILEEPLSNHALAKERALLRDSYRCVISGDIDPDAPEDKKRPGVRRARTQATCILPESINENTSGQQNDKQHAATFCFGKGLMFDELNGAGVYRLENVMTMRLDLRLSFDHLEIWLESTGVLNEYMLCAVHEDFLVGFPTCVTFTNSDPENLPSPSAEYLKFHAACARVAHLSGAGEYIEDGIRDVEEISVLAADGSSMDVLNFALSRHTDASVY